MLKVIVVALLLAYPFIVYFGIKLVSVTYISLFLLTIILLRFWSFRSLLNKFPALPLVTAATTVLLLYGSFTQSELALKLYPVVVSACFLVVFAYSLFKPPAVITLIASLTEKLDQAGIRYTQKVTLVWCIFFLFNCIIASLSIYLNQGQYWLIYNGFISYLLMGILLGTEYLVRIQVKKHNKQ
ncbi:hypothetical protein N7931_13565 [Catenovulum sp. 2E275]|uniref:COG4648 family protein n=1 Tax=Catenovulum sp. 2E275 TaxID=2980497 RepID=UPI0021D1A76D|nr:hypothetical protein [Catenovulum sp. 2E275]MCU4676660.1 hypothetical protein [Catenovulum sp. 2E275]